METTAKHTQGPWIDKHTAPDSLGRVLFTLRWLAQYHPGDPRGEHRLAIRGQVFFADPSRFSGVEPWTVNESK